MNVFEIKRSVIVSIFRKLSLAVDVLKITYWGHAIERVTLMDQNESLANDFES